MVGKISEALTLQTSASAWLEVTREVNRLTQVVKAANGNNADSTETLLIHSFGFSKEKFEDFSESLFCFIVFKFCKKIHNGRFKKTLKFLEQFG